jgi:uncharacterized protein YbaR (Trm112 family)/SAM-dependent methyltransferase
MHSTPVLILVLIAGYGLARLVWQRLRLRRALFVLIERIAWSIKHAPRDKLVLDVGSGDNPHLRADVLCEKYLHDNLYRSGSVALDRPLVAGDASALPFKTGAFDVLVSSHLIGHLKNPQSFFRDAGRVAKSGLFIAPSSIFEQLFSIHTHLWLIEQKENALHFVPKSQPICHPVIHKFFENYVLSSLLKLDSFLLDHWESLIVTYNWKDNPECVVVGEPLASKFVRASTSPAGAVVTQHKVGALERLRGWLRRWVRNGLHAVLSSNHKIDWANILACPKCRGDVSVSKNEVYCPNCELHFPVDRGIPIMLLDLAVTKQPSEHSVTADGR